MTPEEKLRIDYKGTTEYFFHLAETRFRLLGILPVVTGLAVAGLPKLGSPEQGLALAVLGLGVTIGLTIYDQRNTQIYDRLVLRAKFLEDQLGFQPCPIMENGRPLGRRGGGAFRDRPPRRSIGSVQIIWHDLALAVVYSLAITAWFYLTLQQYAKLAQRSEVGASAWAASILAFGMSMSILIWLARLNDRASIAPDTRKLEAESESDKPHNQTSAPDATPP